ncbi:MAG: hypothetical protein Ct9H300mP11_31620 [Chloroflexota bacterium]|nr:MAG: hypothetical protein Ct9H300mP11_31620 [Chloroflexota bacterium]
MSVVVRIPTPLRRMTNGKDKVEVESTVLGELVDKLNAEFPGFKDRLVDEEGGTQILREYILKRRRRSVHGRTGYCHQRRR